MCCRCCTTLKVAGTWGASIHISVGLLLLIGYFVIDEDLGDYHVPYLVYIGLLIPLGVIILFAVHKEIDWLLRGVSWIFIITQIFGFGVRLLVPAQKTTSWTILQRIAALFTGILATAIYSAILILFSRKLRKAKKAAAIAAAAHAEIEGDDEDLEGGSNVTPGPSRSAPTEGPRNIDS